MIGFIQGKILYASQPILVDVQGVGYEIFIPERTLPSVLIGNKISLYIVTIVKDDAIELLGFESLQEKILFKLLTSIDSIGPKSALNILGQIEPQNLINLLIHDHDIPKFKGVGKTVSERLNSELRAKVKKNYGLSDLDPLKSDHSVIHELKLALIDLGYSERHFQQILPKLDPKKELNFLITQALQLINPNIMGAKL